MKNSTPSIEQATKAQDRSIVKEAERCVTVLDECLALGNCPCTKTQCHHAAVVRMLTAHYECAGYKVLDGEDNRFYVSLPDSAKTG